MYPSGVWRGFWVQEGFGRQPMEAFELRFHAAAVTGQGHDIVGPFVVRGEWERADGSVRLLKTYLGRHTVAYDGGPDGEGCIVGTWRIGADHSGPFRLHPVVSADGADEPIIEITK